MQNIRVESPAELLSAVPYLLGFHPTDSLVLVGLQDKRLHFTCRANLPAPGGPVRELAEHLVGILGRQPVDAAVVVGFGPPERVTPAVDATRAALTNQALPILDELRVTDGRFWSYTCSDLRCCPPEGLPYRPQNSLIAAEATLAGHVVLPDRAELARSLAPIDGPDRRAMTLATDRAGSRLIKALEAADGQPDRLLAEGRTLVEVALTRSYTGGQLTDDEAAWLSMLLLYREVRDTAWDLIGRNPDDPHLALWRDLLRRAEPGLVAPVGTLLAYAAYLAGEGATASIALDRARADDPDYPMVHLLGQAIRAGLPARKLRAAPSTRPPGRRPGKRRRYRTSTRSGTE